MVTGTRAAEALTLGFFLSVQRPCLPVADAAGQRCVWRRLTHEPLPWPGGNCGSSPGGLREGVPPGQQRVSQECRRRTSPSWSSEELSRPLLLACGPSGQYLISIPGHPHTRPPQPGRGGKGVWRRSWAGGAESLHPQPVPCPTRVEGTRHQGRSCQARDPGTRALVKGGHG